jgi:hypothetical protein
MRRCAVLCSILYLLKAGIIKNFAITQSIDMKKLTLAFLLLTVCFAKDAASQSNIPVFKKDSTGLNDYLYRYIAANFELEKYDTMCLSSSTFIKFAVSKKGNVENLRFTHSTPGIIKTIFTKALLSTNGNWKHTGKAQAGKEAVALVLPVSFIFESNCRPADRAVNSVLNILTDDSDPDASKPGLPGTAYKKPLHCIILNPLFLKSGYQ